MNLHDLRGSGAAIAREAQIFLRFQSGGDFHLVGCDCFEIRLMCAFIVIRKSERFIQGSIHSSFWWRDAGKLAEPGAVEDLNGENDDRFVVLGILRGGICEYFLANRAPDGHGYLIL